MSKHNEDKNWERVSKLLRDADCVPDPPDCRERVMSRIARPRRSWAWAYACTALVVAIAGSMLMLPHSGEKHTTASRPHPNPPLRGEGVAMMHKRTAVVQGPAQQQPLQHGQRSVRQGDARIKQMPRPCPVVKQSPVQPEPAPIVVRGPARPPMNAERPVAIAIVTWPSADSRADSYTYSYKDCSTATGQTTECRVKRSGNSVEIYMESKPEVQEPPVKGSVEHETNPSA